MKDAKKLETWLLDEVLPAEQRYDRLREAALSYFRTMGIEPPGPERLKRHIRAAAQRSKEWTDHLVDLLVEIIHKMGKRAEQKVEENLSGQLQKVPGKLGVLVRMAEAALNTPEGVVNQVIYPVASEDLLKTILQEIQNSGPAYHNTVRIALKRSYQSHYRRMLPELLGTLEFKCENARYQPVMDALAVLKAYLPHKSPSYPEGTKVPIEGVVRPVWMSLVIEAAGDPPKINRVAYEICVLKALREQLRCREIWVEGSRRYRNPDDDLPQDFETKREKSYADLGTGAALTAVVMTLEMTLDCSTVIQ